ncbi:MAG: hypothetical protein HFG39_04115 [Lachnospiraceae bacterium]|nr:hypothetical protein [Lachnospiraceae bacterium]
MTDSSKIDYDAIERKLSQYSKHTEIADEFANWIVIGQYVGDGIQVEGYTAKQLSELSEYLVGEGSFSMLIILREKLEKEKKKIQEGFKIE